ncbi:MAG: CHAD domain-containing protein [Pseudomonas sp.]
MWPSAFQTSTLAQDAHKLKRVIRKTLDKQIHKLQAGVEDVDFDRHQLRILVKRTRYLIDAFPELSPLSDKATKALKSVQSALGSWHDHYQWCLKAEQEADLRPLEKHWAKASASELKEAEKQLKAFARLLPG